MANFKNTPGGISGMAFPVGGVDTTQPQPTDVFTRSIYPGIALFGDLASPTPFNKVTSYANGTTLMTTGLQCIQYIQNDGFVNPNASPSVINGSAAPWINVLCQDTGKPFRILKVIDESNIIVDDPYVEIATGNFWFTRSQLYPNKKVVFISEFTSTIFTMGGKSITPYFNGVVYKFEVGDSINPIEVIGSDVSSGFNYAIK